MTHAAATTITPVATFITEAVADGYVYECSCGELYNAVSAAGSCRKCRNYCVFGYCTHVTDIRTGEVVAGTEPSAEEYAEARELAEARWEEERAEYALQMALYAQEGELYEKEMARQAEEAREAAARLAEDIAYDIQDELMGY